MTKHIFFPAKIEASLHFWVHSKYVFHKKKQKANCDDKYKKI